MHKAENSYIHLKSSPARQSLCFKGKNDKKAWNERESGSFFEIKNSFHFEGLPLPGNHSNVPVFGKQDIVRYQPSKSLLYLPELFPDKTKNYYDKRCNYQTA